MSTCGAKKIPNADDKQPVRVAPEAYYLFETPAPAVPELCDAFKVRYVPVFSAIFRALILYPDISTKRKTSAAPVSAERLHMAAAPLHVLLPEGTPHLGACPSARPSLLARQIPTAARRSTLQLPSRARHRTAGTRPPGTLVVRHSHRSRLACPQGTPRRGTADGEEGTSKPPSVTILCVFGRVSLFFLVFFIIIFSCRLYAHFITSLHPVTLSAGHLKSRFVMKKYAPVDVGVQYCYRRVANVSGDPQSPLDLLSTTHSRASKHGSGDRAR